MAQTDETSRFLSLLLCIVFATHRYVIHITLLLSTCELNRFARNFVFMVRSVHTDRQTYRHGSHISHLMWDLLRLTPITLETAFSQHGLGSV